MRDSFIVMFNRVNDLVKLHHPIWNDPYHRDSLERQHLQAAHATRLPWPDRHGALWVVYDQFLRHLLPLQPFPTDRGMVEQQELAAHYDCNQHVIDQLQ